MLTEGLPQAVEGGDKVEIHWTNAEGADASVEVVPTESDIAHMTFACTEALDELADDTELTFTFEIGGKSAGAGTKVIGA